MFNRQISDLSNGVRKASLLSLKSLRRASAASIQSVKSYFSATSEDSWTSLNNQIDSVRDIVLDKMKNSPKLYHPKDVLKLQENEWLVKRFVLDNKEIDAAATALDTTLMWRKANRVNEGPKMVVPQEFYELGILSKGQDEDITVAYIRLKYINTKILGDWREEVKVMINCLLNKIDEEAKENQWALVIDYSGAGIANFDLPLFSYIISVAFSHFPLSLKYVWLYEPSWYLKPLINALLLVIPGKYRKVAQVMDRKRAKVEMGSNLPTVLGGRAAVKPMEEGDFLSYEVIANSHGYSRDVKKRFKDYYNENIRLLKKENL